MSDGKFIRLTPNELDILQVLIAAASEVYGLAIFKRVNEVRTTGNFDFDKIGYGSFYAALKKLERENLIKSSTPEKDQRKKHYKITPPGVNVFNENIRFMQALSSQTKVCTP